MLKIIKKQILKAAKKIEGIKAVTFKEKTGAGNIVTNADMESEKIIMEGLKKAFPGSQFLAEETKTQITEENFNKIKLLFVVDPIDGTTNFKFGIPPSAISVAAYEFGKPRCGAIYDLFGKNLYECEAGKGVFINGRKMERKNISALSSAVVGSSFAYGNSPKELIEKWEKLIGKVATLRVMGSAVMDLVMTATGQFSCYFHNSMKPYDLAAGLLMLKEMGVKAANWEGEESTIFDEKIIAAPPNLYDDFYNLLL